jgi:hypothetical protein
MNEILAILFGVFLYALFVLIVLASFKLNKGSLQEQEADDADQINSVSKPVELERPHVRAGSTWTGDMK